MRIKCLTTLIVPWHVEQGPKVACLSDGRMRIRRSFAIQLIGRVQVSTLLLAFCLTSSPLCCLVSLMILHEAIANANLRTVADALTQRPDDVNLLDEQRRSVLFCAIVGFKYV